MVSSAVALTNQFYDWEQRGRGWHMAPFSCDLEPVFVPFFGHYIETENIIDDGKQPSFFNRLFAPPKEDDTSLVPFQPPEQYAYRYSGSTGDLTIYTITLPKTFKQSKERIGQFLVMLSYRKSPISFELIAHDDTVTLEWTVKDTDAAFFYSQLRIFFPECAVMETYDDIVLDVLQAAPCVYTVDFGLAEECMRPIAVLNSDFDPYTSLFGILERLDCDEAVIIQILFCGVHNAWAESMVRSVTDTTGKGSFFVDAPDMPGITKEKVSKPLFAVTMRMATVSDTMEQAATLLDHVATSLVHASTSPTNSFVPLGGAQYTVNMRLADIVMRETHRVGMLLNVSELANFVHFPAMQSSQLLGSSRTTKLAPFALTNHSYILGSNEHMGRTQEVSIATSQRLRHIHIMGATGTGKSTLLKSLMIQDIHSGTGMMCLDPHGDLIEDLLHCIPEHRIKDVVLIDPHDAEYPIGLNILVAHSDVEKELLASDLVALFRRFSTSWGDQMNSVFANAILAFMYNTKQYHLGDVRRFFIEASYRTQILSTVTDHDIVYYWSHEFPIVKGASIGPILTRLDTFLRPKVIRNMVCQTKSLDFAQLMDTKKIVLVKLSQGLLGAENSYLLGAFILSKLQQTAMARQAITVQDRIPFFCYIDEFQHFITPSMASILSGARKYAFGLVLTHQDMQQVSKYDTEIAGSVLANAGTRIYFRLGDTDAKRLEDGFNGFSASDFQNLATGEAIVRVNTTDQACNISVIPYYQDEQESFVERIIDNSRAKYSVPIIVQTPIVVPEEPGVPPVASNAPPTEPRKTEQSPPVPPQKAIISTPPIPVPDEPPTVPPEQLREHRYLQNFVKALAEGRGYKASLEVKTPDGKGQVDVVLEKEGTTIAVEICVTTGAQWELHNIKKCLAAGFSRVVVCVTQPAKQSVIQTKITKQLTSSEQANVTVIASDAIATLFDAESSPVPTETVVKGYRVKVNYEPNATRQNILQSIINANKKR